MKKNDRLQGECIDYTHDGLGIVKVDNFAFFIKGILVKETVSFVVTKLKKNYGYGRCLQILIPSEERTEPFCPYYGKCGGCQLQHMSQKEQLCFKRNLVRNNVERLAGIQVPIYDTLGMKDTVAYRNKAQFPVKVNERIRVGFYRLHSNEIIDMNMCKIQSDLINKIMYAFKQALSRYPFVDVFRHLLIKHAFSTNEVMVVLIVRKRIDVTELIDSLVAKFPEIKSVILNINKRNDNVILGDKEFLLYGKDKIMDRLDDLSFMISSKSFYQVNPRQTEVLYQQVLAFAQLNKDDIVVDLYCGIGTISLYLARKAKLVIGIEVVAQAIEDAKENARVNAIDNVEFICSDAGEYAQQLVNDNVKPNVVVVDPPRKGCDLKTLKSIHQMNPEKIIYISCNPATLARDIKELSTYGFKVECIQPVDMFFHTIHIESVVRLTRTK